MKNLLFVGLRKLQQVVYFTAQESGLIAPSCEDVARMYFMGDGKLLPIIKPCGLGTMGVDKYYVAYQVEDGDVHYTYISKHHINEEVCSYRIASKERGKTIPLPPDILKAFKIAHHTIMMNGEPYWIDPEILERFREK